MLFIAMQPKSLLLFYKLDDAGKPTACTIAEHCAFIGTPQHRKTHKVESFITKLGHVYVSTVFIGMDRSTGKAESPQVWETKVFSTGLGKHAGMAKHAASQEEADRQRASIVDHIRKREGSPGLALRLRLIAGQFLMWLLRKL